jgi:pyridoxine 4-dehydrogenase
MPMSNISAAKSGTFKLGNELSIHRLGFGAMRIVGAGVGPTFPKN